MPRWCAVLAALTAVVVPAVRGQGPIDKQDEIDAEKNGVLINDACERSIGQLHTLVQPSFPSSGRGWTQKLLFLALQSAGAGKFNDTGAFKFGHKSFPTHKGAGAPVVEWVFTHESDRATEGRMAAHVAHPERPPLVFRVVRSALENVEANYRYVKKEGGKTGTWDRFATDKIQRYRKFHRYWDQRCGYNTPPGTAVATATGTARENLPSSTAPCCVTVTYEDMQVEAFLRRALKKVLQLWLGAGPSASGFTAEAIARGADAAVDAVPPKHSNELLFKSGKRYTPAHHLALISPLSLQENGKMS